MTNEKKRIFISHIHEEAEIGAVLKKWIEDAFVGEVEAFVSSDPRDLPGGRQWLSEIETKLRDPGNCLLVSVLSPASIGRPWISLEFGGAWIRGTPIFPFCHSGQTNSSLPRPLGDFQGASIEQKNVGELIINAIACAADLPFPAKLNLDAMRAELDAAIARIATQSALLPNSRAPSPDVSSKHDVWLLDALWYIAFRRWNVERRAVNLASQVQLVSTAREEVMQAIADCDLKLWGKDTTWSSGPWREIACDYWRTHKIEFWEPLKDDPESLRTEVNMGNPDLIYVALKTSKAQVERLWPGESQESSLDWTDFRMTLVDLAKEATNYGWNFSERELEVIDFRDGLRQAGVDGTIRMWGRKQHQFEELTRQEPLQEIDKRYWRRQNWIDPISWMRIDTRKGTFAGFTDDNFQTRTVTVTDSERYADIHVDRAQALLWLRGAAKTFIGRNKSR